MESTVEWHTLAVVLVSMRHCALMGTRWSSACGTVCYLILVRILAILSCGLWVSSHFQSFHTHVGIVLKTGHNRFYLAFSYLYVLVVDIASFAVPGARNGKLEVPVYFLNAK